MKQTLFCEDFLRGPTSPSPHATAGKRDVAPVAPFPRNRRSSDPSYGPCCETLHRYAPPSSRVSADLHAALVLRLHLAWIDDRECLVFSSAPGRHSPYRSQLKPLTAVPAALGRTSLRPLGTLLALTSPPRSSGPPSSRLILCTALAHVQAYAAAPQGAPCTPGPVGQTAWSPAAGHERLSHCISTHPTPFLFLAPGSPLGPGCLCRQMPPGRGEHGVLALPTRSLFGGSPKPVFLLVGLHRYRLVFMPTTRMAQSGAARAVPAPAVPVEVLYCCAASSGSPEVCLNNW